MSNPALELHDIYSSWHESIATSKNRNSMTGHLAVNTKKGMAKMTRAFALLAAIDSLLDRFERDGVRTSPFRAQFDGWARVPLSMAQGWTAAVSQEHLVSTAVLQQIEGFGAYLEGKVYVLGSAQHVNLRSLIDQADALLTDEDLDPLLVQYLRRLIAAIRYALDDEAAGVVFDFEEAVSQLWLAFTAAANSAPESSAPKWRSMLEQFSIGVLSGGAVEGAIKIAEAITKAIP